MADTKKPDEATSETDRTEEELVAEVQSLPEEDEASDPETDLENISQDDNSTADEPSDGAQSEDALPDEEALGEEIVGDDLDAVDAGTGDILGDDLTADDFEDDDDGAGLGAADADTLESAGETGPEDASQASGDDMLDDDTIDDDDLAALEDLDGTGVFKDIDHGAEQAAPAAAPAAATTAGAASIAAAAVEPVIEPEPRPEVIIEKVPEPHHGIEKETVVVERRGGVVGGFVGGVVAALGLAFAAPYVIPPRMMPFNTVDLREQVNGQAQTIDALKSDIDTLRGQLAETASGADLAAARSAAEELVAGVNAALADLKANAATNDALAAANDAIGALTAGNATLSADTAAIQDRILELEKRPIAEATNPAAVSALKAYETEVAKLREAVAQQMQQAQDLVAKTTAAADDAVRKAAEASDAAKAEAAAAEQEAAARALAAKRAQALVDIQTALDSGAPFETYLPALDGVTVPAALTAAAADGAPTLPELRSDFTLAAREALAASRRATESDGLSGRTATFLQTQLGLRSLSPREGDDPDAVLSRAEAAVADARLTDAVAELSALPEAGQQAMAAWIAKANARTEALAAADELAASLADN